MSDTTQTGAGEHPSDATIEALSSWVRVESPTDDAAGVNRMMDLVTAGAAASGIAAERVPGRDGLGDGVILRAGPATGAKSILVLSHLDTVHPVGTLARDLPCRVEGDRIYGPGVLDMKGGADLAFEAFKQAAHSAPQRPLVFLFTPDEEIGSPSTRGLIEDLARDADYALVTEPGRDGGRVVTSRKGVGRFDVHVEGRPSHAGTRHTEGRNAIYEAARQIAAIEALTDYARGITVTVGLIEGGTAENVVPQHCRFSVDLRVVTAADGDEMAARILGLAPVGADFRITVTGGMNRPPYERTEGVSALYAHAQGLAAGLGFDLHDVPRTGGGSDGNFTAALGVPTLDGLGIDGEGAHTLSEYGLLSSLTPRMRLMKGLLETLR